MVTKEYLENFGIHELRLRGRELGVKSPASKRKSQLIEEIIEIENGIKPAYRTNMGRKPKKIGVYNEEIRIIMQNATLTKNGYDNCDKINTDGEIALNSKDISSIKLPLQFMGIARKINNKIIVTNYYNDDCKYIELKDDANGIKEGSLICGNIEQKMDGFVVKDYKLVQFDTQKNSSNQKCKLVTLENEKQMIDYVKSNNGKKLVFQVEANQNTASMLQDANTYFFATNECTDVAFSFNLMLDCKNMINTLVNQDANFTLYLMDIDYMYAMINAYFYAKNNNGNQELNAGQMFKEIIASINNSKNANLVVLHNKNTKHNPYLDIILQRYCQNN